MGLLTNTIWNLNTGSLPMFDIRPIAIGIGALVLTLLWRVSSIGQRPKGYPPGPPTIPILGNLHLMPRKDGHLQFEKWAHEYGPIYSLILGTKVWIVLSKAQVVKDLLDKRGAKYSSRPEQYLAQEVYRHSLGPLFMVWRH